MEQGLNRFEKLMMASRYWLLGMAEHDNEYFKVLEAMEFARQHHDGERNGGAPEFIHQLGIFMHLRTLHKHLRNPVTAYTLTFLHDAIEDPNKNGKFVAPADVTKICGEEITIKLLKLSKKILGQPNPSYSLDAVFDDEDCGPVKGADRVNNVSSMVGVFKQARLERYVKETAEEFFPRLKHARRRFPDQEPVYENIKLELVNQLQLIQHILDNTQLYQGAAAPSGPFISDLPQFSSPCP